MSSPWPAAPGRPRPPAYRGVAAHRIQWRDRFRAQGSRVSTTSRAVADPRPSMTRRSLPPPGAARAPRRDALVDAAAGPTAGRRGRHGGAGVASVQCSHGGAGRSSSALTRSSRPRSTMWSGCTSSRRRRPCAVRRREEPDPGARPDRAHPSPRPGLPERATHDYVRNGTTTLFAALELATGIGHRSCVSCYRQAASSSTS